jgi:hypothetical protein
MKKLKTFSTLIILFFCQNIILAQNNYSVTVLKNKKSAAVMIEFSGEGRGEQGAFWLNSDAGTKLQEGIKKGINWAKLNEANYKSFEKEIVRFRVTPKSTYNFYKKYIPEFTEECKVMFKGIDDGSFELSMLFKNDNVTDYESILVFYNIESLNNFIGLLQGKAVKNEINDIFK